MAIITQTHRKMLSAEKKHSVAKFKPGQAALVLRLDLVEDAIYNLLNFFLGKLKHGLHSAPISEKHRPEIRVTKDPKSSAMYDKQSLFQQPVTLPSRSFNGIKDGLPFE